mgnify:CR=1 FL=1
MRSRPAPELWRPAPRGFVTGVVTGGFISSLSIVDGFESGVPFHYRRVRMWGPLRGRVHSHVRARVNDRPDERTYDVAIIEDDGRVLVEAFMWRYHPQTDLLEREPHPSDAQVREALAGNLCRCTGYEKILDAVRLAAERMAVLP